MSSNIAAIALIKERLTELNQAIERIIDNMYSVGRRGDLPAGASWNNSQEQEIDRLEKFRDDYEAEKTCLELTLFNWGIAYE